MQEGSRDGQSPGAFPRWGAHRRCPCSLQGALRSAQQMPPGTLGRRLRDVVSWAWTSGHSSRGPGEWGEGQTESRQLAQNCCLQLSPGGR